MRVQHNATTGRDCWKSTRERNRLKARFEIRQRVLDGSDLSLAPEPISSAATQQQRSNGSFEKKELIQEILQRIIHGDRSFFSLQYMQKNHSLLSTPFPTEFLWHGEGDVDGDKLLGEQKLKSWFGLSGVTQLKEWLTFAQETCTFWDYAIWLKRYHVVGSLIVGGINPCIRGRFRNSTTGTGDNTDEKDLSNELLLENIGTRVRQKFFSSVVPLELSSYIVKRVVEMRRFCDGDSVCEIGKLFKQCAICSRQIPPNLRLCYIKSDHGEKDSCKHILCEICVWENIVKCMDTRMGDVVLCPACKTENGCLVASDSTFSEFMVGNLVGSPLELFQESRQKYYALPAGSKEIKNLKIKKKVSERKSLCSTWSESVESRLGFTQSVRREKFFLYIEKKGSYHYIKGCLDHGIDLGLQNEYNQTALFIATWRGDVEVVRLLLRYGCDPNVPANGGVSCIRVARAKMYPEVVKLLEQANAKDVECEMHWALSTYSPSYSAKAASPKIQTLIDWSSEHPGAGSFLLDDVLWSSAIESLITLWKSLPIAQEARKKDGHCSTRSYFCDAVGTVREFLESTLKDTFGGSEILVFAHMRFLCYSHRGTDLAPHVDLSRVDPSTGKRSTHSFLLYLTTCKRGGETALLDGVGGERSNVTIARAKPNRGRLLLFPHRCPHRGLAVEDVPKLLIRGEVLLTRG